jgi:Domain of unknown function (DUF4136)
MTVVVFQLGEKRAMPAIAMNIQRFFGYSRAVLGLSAVYLLASCSSANLQSDYDRTFDFSRLRSWNWAPQSSALQTPAAIKTADRIRLDSLVREHVTKQLTAKGYTRDTERADFLIAWSFGEWELERRSRPGGGYGAVGLNFPGMHGSNLPTSTDGRALPPSIDPYSAKYEQAKLEFIVMDPGTQRILWNASIVDDSDFGYFSSSQKERIGVAVESILRDFPPPR